MCVQAFSYKYRNSCHFQSNPFIWWRFFRAQSRKKKMKTLKCWNDNFVEFMTNTGESTPRSSWIRTAKKQKKKIFDDEITYELSQFFLVTVSIHLIFSAIKAENAGLVHYDLWAQHRTTQPYIHHKNDDRSN